MSEAPNGFLCGKLEICPACLCEKTSFRSLMRVQPFFLPTIARQVTKTGQHRHCSASCFAMDPPAHDVDSDLKTTSGSTEPATRDSFGTAYSTAILSMGKDGPAEYVHQDRADCSNYPKLIEVVRGSIYFLPTTCKKTIQDHSKMKNYRFMTSNIHLSYVGFCDDFGPVAISQVMHFCYDLSTVRAKERNRKLVYFCDPSPRHCANAVFLLVAYLSIELGWEVDDAMAPFAVLDSALIEPFRDATWTQPPVHSLSVRHCVGGLQKALECGWLDSFDVTKYKALSHPLSGNITEIGHKFIAFKGPVETCDIKKGDLASFPPHFYAQTFKQLGVDVVVRLNEPATYDPQPFIDDEMAHVDLFFEDCTVPSAEIVERFLDVCDRQSKVAVHCAAGLGRTGTLIALWLMRRHGFGADEAIGFLRIMRPGCVIGPQQNFLRYAETAIWDGNRIRTRPLRSVPHRLLACEISLSARPTTRHDNQDSECDTSGEATDVKTPRSSAERPSVVGAGFKLGRRDSLFDGLLRVQQAEQLAREVREGMLRREAMAGASDPDLPDDSK